MMVMLVMIVVTIFAIQMMTTAMVKTMIMMISIFDADSLRGNITEGKREGEEGN